MNYPSWGIACNLQGNPNQSFPFQMAVTLKLCISDSMFVKPKCIWEVTVFLKNCKQTAEKCKKNWKKLKKTTASQTHFGFTNIGSEMHTFRVSQNKFQILIWVTL